MMPGPLSLCSTHRRTTTMRIYAAHYIIFTHAHTHTHTAESTCACVHLRLNVLYMFAKYQFGHVYRPHSRIMLALSALLISRITDKAFVQQPLWMLVHCVSASVSVCVCACVWLKHSLILLKTDFNCLLEAQQKKKKKIKVSSHVQQVCELLSCSKVSKSYLRILLMAERKPKRKNKLF